jgi:hypothetical protein
MRSVDAASGRMRGVVCRGLKTTDLHSHRATKRKEWEPKSDEDGGGA